MSFPLPLTFIIAILLSVNLDVVSYEDYDPMKTYPIQTYVPC